MELNRRRRAFLAIIFVVLTLPKVAAAQNEPVNRPLSQTAINQAHIVPDTTLDPARIQPDCDSLANGMLVGAGIGAAVGMLVVPRVICGSNDDSKCSTIVRVLIGLPVVATGVGFGALVDGLHKGDARPAGVSFNVRW